MAVDLACFLEAYHHIYRGAVEGVGDLLLVVDGDPDVLAVPAELRRELARAADAGDG
jgi:hypothetical protein